MAKKAPQPKRCRRPKTMTWRQTAKYWWCRIPASNHGSWSVVRLAVLAGVMYANATNFDSTEGKTLLTMTLLEVAGLKRRT